MIKLNAFCNDMSETAFSLIFKNLMYRIYPFKTMPRMYLIYIEHRTFASVLVEIPRIAIAQHIRAA